MLKVYGSLLCPDCIACKEAFEASAVEFEYHDFADGLLALKEFLRLRDTEPVFAQIREAGKIGIPCIVCEDGRVSLNWEEFVSGTM